MDQCLLGEQYRNKSIRIRSALKSVRKKNKNSAVYEPSLELVVVTFSTSYMLFPNERVKDKVPVSRWSNLRTQLVESRVGFQLFQLVL